MPDSDDKPTGKKPRPLNKYYDWSKYDNLGIARDHHYQKFLETGQDHCPECGNQHLTIKWITYPGLMKRPGVPQGWKWRCLECDLIWLEPRVTPGIAIFPSQINLKKLEETK